MAQKDDCDMQKWKRLIDFVLCNQINVEAPKRLRRNFDLFFAIKGKQQEKFDEWDQI